MMARLYCAGLLAGLLASGSALAAVDLNGVWQVAQSVQELKTVEGKAPPLKPEAATSTDLRADNTLLDSAGLPHSESLKVTEKVRLLDNGATLENRITIDDPETFTQPWETVVRFKKLPKGTEIKEDICLDRLDAGKPAVDWARRRGS